MGLMIDCGVILFARCTPLNARRRVVSSIARRIVGHHVGIENRPPPKWRAARPMVWISDPAGAQEAFLIRVQHRHQRDFRQIQPFAQQIDADQHVVTRRGAGRAES